MKRLVITCLALGFVVLVGESAFSQRRQTGDRGLGKQERSSTQKQETDRAKSKSQPATAIVHLTDGTTLDAVSVTPLRNGDMQVKLTDGSTKTLAKKDVKSIEDVSKTNADTKRNQKQAASKQAGGNRSATQARSSDNRAAAQVDKAAGATRSKSAANSSSAAKSAGGNRVMTRKPASEKSADASKANSSKTTTAETQFVLALTGVNRSTLSRRDKSTRTSGESRPLKVETC